MPGYHSNKINFVQFTYSWKCKKRGSLVKWVLVKQNTKGKYFFPIFSDLWDIWYIHTNTTVPNFICMIKLKTFISDVLFFFKLIVKKKFNSIFVYFPTQWELKWLNLVILKLLGAKKRLATLWDLLKYSYYTSVFR